MMNRIIDNRRGYIFVMSAIALPVLIGFAGLALDVGMLHLRSSQIQHALDIASYNAVTFYMERDDIVDLNVREAEAERVGSLLGGYNLRRMGIEDGYIDVDLADHGSGLVASAVPRNIPTNTLFIHVLGNIGGSRNIADGRIAKTAVGANAGETAIAIVLDATASMHDHWMDHGVSRPKIESSKDKAQQFVSNLPIGVDLAVITYNEFAYVNRPLAPLTDHRSVINIIEGMRIEGSTNIAHAIAAGRTQLLQSSAPNKYLILFTDGAANLYTAAFDDIKTTSPGGFSGWKPLVDDSYFNASPYKNTINWVIGNADFRAPRPPNRIKQIKCDNPRRSDVGGDSLQTCLDTLSTIDSEGDTHFDLFDTSLIQTFDKNVMMQTLADAPQLLQEVARQAWYMALHEADHAKDDGITIFSIGAGAPAMHHYIDLHRCELRISGQEFGPGLHSRFDQCPPRRERTGHRNDLVNSLRCSGSETRTYFGQTYTVQTGCRAFHHGQGWEDNRGRQHDSFYLYFDLIQNLSYNEMQQITEFEQSGDTVLEISPFENDNPASGEYRGAFLRRIANDPESLLGRSENFGLPDAAFDPYEWDSVDPGSYPTFDTQQPKGRAYHATVGEELEAAYQDISRKFSGGLRLVQ